MKLKLLLLWACAAFVNGTFAQNPIKQNLNPANRIVDLQFHYTYVTTGGDVAKLYNNFHGVGGGASFKNGSNWIFGAEASYYFGSEVKDKNILFNLTNSNGYVLNNAGGPADINIGMRGFNTMIKIGKLIPLTHYNRNSGILLMAGGGILMHKINIHVTDNNVPSLTEEKKKGYDRYTSGFAATQFVGYMHHSANRFYNFFAGVDIIEGFTKNRRGYNNDQMAYDNKNKFDILIGFRLGWTIPIYLSQRNQEEFYYK